MADIGQAIFARLDADAGVGALVGNKIAPLVVPQGWALPFVRYQVIGDNREEHLQGNAALRRTSMQIDAFAATYADARALAAALVAALVPGPWSAADVAVGRVAVTGPRDLFYEAVLQVEYRCTIDLVIHWKPD